MRGTFDNTGKLVKLILRRERIMSSIWIIALALFSIGLAPALGEMFSGGSVESFMSMITNPSMIAMVGPAYYDVSTFTNGAMYSHMMLVWMIITVGVMNIFFVVRHTRGDEERGRVEVVRSLPTGRLANLNATMISAVIVNAVLALITGLGIAVIGVEGMDFSGSLLYGIALGISGLFFAALTALFCQLSSSSRGATGLSFMALFVIYMLRAVGDMQTPSNEIISCISPIGLIQRTQVYVNDYWWPIFVLLIETAVVMAVAYILNAIRDLDQGFIHAKPGRREATPLLRSSFGLSFRLIRNTLIWWLIAMFAIGASYGTIMGDINKFAAENEFYGTLMMLDLYPGFTVEKMFVSMITSIMSLFALAAVLMVVLKFRGEEKDYRAEHVLSRAVSRVKFISGYTIIAFAASVIVQCATAVGIYASASSVMDNPGDLPLGYLLEANLVFLPAIWVMIGVTVLLIGLLPKATAAIWGYFGVTFFVTFLGRLPGIPEWLPKITPFGYIPLLPMESVNYGTLTVLTIIAAVLTAAGFFFYRKRDMSL